VKYAIDRFVNDKEGKEIEVSASDIYEQYRGGYIPRKHDRFFCPECQERVFWRCRGGQQPDVFYHQKKTDFSPECDKRVDGNSDLHIYERTGLPIYITHKYGDVYNLNIAFPALGEQRLQQAYNNKLTVSINGKLTVPVTPSQFYADEITPVPIDFIPYYEKNYTIEISGAGAYAIQKKWSDYADGFSSEGAIFSIHNNFGKKIKRGDSITIEKEYYLIAKDFRPFYQEIRARKIGRIHLNNSDYGVYIFSINISVENSRFNSINSYFYSRFKVWLLEKAATVLPLWPPIIDHGDQLVFSNKATVYCDVESGNSTPKVFTYSGKDVRQIPVDEDYHNNKTVKLGVYSFEPTVVSVDRKYTGREISIRKTSPIRSVASHNIVLSTENEETIDTTLFVDANILQDGINIRTNTKFTAVFESANHVFKTIPIVDTQTTLEPYKGLKRMFFTYGSSPYGYVIFHSFAVNAPQKSFDIDEQLLLSEAKKHLKGSLITAPLWIKELFRWCYIHGLHQLSAFLRLALQDGKINEQLAIYLSNLRRNLSNE